MQTSVIIAIILGVLLLAAIVAIIVMVVIGKKDLKDDFKTLLKYGIDQLVQIPGAGGDLNPQAAAAAAAAASINYNCVADTFADNFNTEQQITILGILSSIINIATSNALVIPPPNITAIINVYSLDLSQSYMTNLILGMCKCVQSCANDPNAPADIRAKIAELYQTAAAAIVSRMGPERYTRERYCGQKKHKVKRA